MTVVICQCLHTVKRMKDNNGSISRFVIGVIGMVIFGILLIATLPGMLIFHRLTPFLLPMVIIFAVIFVLSGILMNSGIKRKNLIGRLSRYMAELTTRQDVLSIEDMAGTTGFLPMQIKNDMRLMKRLDLSFDLYMDKEETTLMKGKQAYGFYLDTERQRDEMEREEAERQRRLLNPETATLEVFRSEGIAIIDKLRAAILVLPGEEISNSLSELEKTTKRIFDHIENHPEKLPQARKLMNYHLPTTMRLVEKYCQYDTMEYQPSNVTSAKTDIEKAISAATEAFANFLESLYHEETLDVTTDAEVLTQMFEKDGLTGKKFEIENDNN